MTSQCETSGPAKMQKLPDHNLPSEEKNVLEQAAFWHELKVV